MADLIVVLNQVNQRALRRERVFRDRTNPLDIFDDRALIERYRFPKESINNLIALVNDDVSRETLRTHAIPANIQVLLTLRYVAKGDFFSEVGDIHGVSKSSVSRIIHRVSKAINRQLNNISFPEELTQLRKLKSNFYSIAQFPNCIGAIDGTLIPIAGMAGPQEVAYVCRKNFHALNVQGVCDANMRFININTKYPGATHDSYILMNSSLPNIVEVLPEGGWLVGDSGYPLKTWLMTPFQNPTNQTEINFNNVHAKTRTIVERSFGILKARFRCLHKSGGCLPFSPIKCAVIIETCFRLHNKAIDDRVPLLGIDNHVVNINNMHVYRNLNAPRSVFDLRKQVATRLQMDA